MTLLIALLLIPTMVAYTGALQPKKKSDLQEIAQALSIQDTGSKEELLARIKKHLDANQDALEDDPVFAGLFGRRKRSVQPPHQQSAAPVPLPASLASVLSLPHYVSDADTFTEAALRRLPQGPRPPQTPFQRSHARPAVPAPSTPSKSTPPRMLPASSKPTFPPRSAPPRRRPPRPSTPLWNTLPKRFPFRLFRSRRRPAASSRMRPRFRRAP